MATKILKNPATQFFRTIILKIRLRHFLEESNITTSVRTGNIAQFNVASYCRSSTIKSSSYLCTETPTLLKLSRC